MMEGEKAFVKVWNDLSDHFEVTKGLKRGDELIHLLFNPLAPEFLNFGTSCI
jgi:hypothetical protein